MHRTLKRERGWCERSRTVYEGSLAVTEKNGISLLDLGARPVKALNEGKHCFRIRVVPRY